MTHLQHTLETIQPIFSFLLLINDSEGGKYEEICVNCMVMKLYVFREHSDLNGTQIQAPGIGDISISQNDCLFKKEYDRCCN